MKADRKADRGRAERRRAGADSPPRPVRKRRDKRTIYIVCAVLAAVFIISVAVVLRGVSDKRVYNNYMQQAQQSYSQNDFDSALAALRKAAAVDETDECLMLMADCYETQENYTKALEILRTMNVQNPTVSSRIAAIEKRRQTLSEAEKVTIAGRQYPLTTTSLVLDNMGITDAALDDVLQLYALDSLSLAGNSLYDISKLTSLGGLVSLNLSGNNISSLAPLTSLTGLRTLYLDNNPVTDLTPLYSLTNLTSLSIKGISITESQLEALSKALPNCAIHSEAAQEEVQDISFGGATFKSDVTELDLSGMGLRDISALANCENLISLNLSNNSISDLSPLMNIPTLQWLDVSYNQLSDLRPLMGISSLRFLNASGNSITSTAPLSMMDGLTELYLDGNPLKSFSSLKKLKNLTSLGLSGTGLNDEGMRCLNSLVLLRTLNVEDNPDITGEAVDELRSKLGNCTISHSELAYSVDIDGNTITTIATELSMPNRGIIDLSSLSQLGCLQTVDLSGNCISNVYPFQYSDSRFTIISLNLSSNRLEDATPLSTLQNIETLDLSNNYISSELPFMAMFSLRTLVLTDNPLTEEQVESIRNALPNCDVIF